MASFTTRETVKILNRLHLDCGHDNLKDWHRRKILPGEPVGKGNERSYSLEEVAFIASLAFVAPHMRYGGLLEAVELARGLADCIVRVHTAEPPHDLIDTMPVYALVYRHGQAVFEPVTMNNYRLIAGMYGFNGAVMVHPAQMAAELGAAIEDVTNER